MRQRGASLLGRVSRHELVRPALLILTVLLLWEGAVRLFKIPPYLVPAPEQVLRTLAKEWPKLLAESSLTTYATLGGFALSVVIGIPLATLIAYSRTFESFVYPLLVFSQSVPKVAVAPLFVVWFGFGVFPKIVCAFLLGVFPIIVATVTGLKSVEPEMIDLARSMRAGRLKTFWWISLPYSLPSIFAGMKVAITLAVVGAVVGEFVGSNSGIGYVLQLANGNFDLPLMFAALLVLSLIGVALFTAIEFAERRLIPWHASRRNVLYSA